MKFKWYISALIAVISYFVVKQQSNDVPNQEIVLTYTQANTCIDYEQAIANVKKQLLSIGAKNVAVFENGNGFLKVTYYSSLTLQNVKNQLFIGNEAHGNIASLRFKNTTEKDPTENSFLDYQIDIYEINDDLVSGMDHQSKSYFELKQDFSRASQVHFSMIPQVSTNSVNRLIRVQEKVNSSLLFTFNKISFKIPEVRAGPLS